MMKRLFIWGAGEIGKRVLNHLNKKWDIIFVDSNKAIINTFFQKRKIISIEEYMDKFSTQFILIAHLHEVESISVLQKNNITNYFLHCDLAGDFKESYIRDYLKEYIISYLGTRTDYVLYGLGIYSLIVEDWIFTHFGIHPYILKQDSFSNELTDKIIQQYDGLNIIDDIRNVNGIKEVCVCLDNYLELKQYGIFEDYHLTDIYDCSDKIKNYHNAELKKFYNIHKEKRCFIVATGPSLKMEDLDLLKEQKEICISMNSIYYAFDKTDWRPDYFVAEDYKWISSELPQFFDNLPIQVKFIGDTSEIFWNNKHEKNIYQYHKHYEYFYDRLPKFSDDFSKRSYAGSTVTYACLQLAVYMGFKEIYLLGVDFSSGDIKNSKYAHFHIEEELVAVCFKRQVGAAYISAKRYADQHGIKIYNATRGGELEVFTRVDFDTLFTK